MKRQIILSLAFSVLAANAFAASSHPVVAEGGSDRLIENRVAEGGSDRLIENRVAEGGSDRLIEYRVAEGGSDRLIEY
ncbi:phage infection protein, partial [Pseudomonas corrugata]|nr:phage infection protein [Pseudomonas corrugata]